MPILQMRQATASSNAIDVFNTLNSSMPSTFRPLIAPALASQADILGFPVDTLRKRPPRRNTVRLRPVGFCPLEVPPSFQPNPLGLSH